MPWRQLARITFTMLLHPRLVWEWWLGVVIARPVRADSTEVKAVLTAIAVNPEILSKGIGRSLVHAFEEFLRKGGVDMYRLDTHVKNERACRFYRELGFEEIARRADSIVFVRKLNQ
jgi:ribosomal protein S18 acetylase RimI-like enzyme